MRAKKFFLLCVNVRDCTKIYQNSPANDAQGLAKILELQKNTSVISSCIIWLSSLAALTISLHVAFSCDLSFLSIVNWSFTMRTVMYLHVEIIALLFDSNILACVCNSRAVSFYQDDVIKMLLVYD